MRRIFILAIALLAFLSSCSDNKKRKQAFFSTNLTILGDNYDSNTSVTSITTSSSTGTYIPGATVTIQINYNGPVNVTDPANTSITLSNGDVVQYSGGSGTNSLTFTYVVGPTSPSTDTINVSSINGELTAVQSQLVVNPAVPSANSPQSLSGSQNIGVDTNLPKVTNISSTNANGTYALGQTVQIEVDFSEVVVVNGVPQLYLNIGGGQAVYASYVSGSGSTKLVFEYTVGSGHSTSGGDLNQSATNSLILPTGATIKDVNGNNALGGSDATGYPTGTNYVTIPDPVTSPTLSGNKDIIIDSNAAIIAFGTAGSGSGLENIGTGTIPFTLSKATNQAVTVNYQVLSGGTASSGVDYSGLTGSVSLTNGATSGNISFTVIDDTLYEGNETILLQITSITGAAIGTQKTFTYTITDNDPKPTLTFTNGTTNSVNENVSGGTYSAGFTLSNPSATDITFTVNTADGTATAGGDYTSISSQTITIPAGQTTASTSVTILDDSIYEGSESFAINLTGLSSNAQFTGAASNISQTVTINDNEIPPFPTLSFNAGSTASVAESAGNYSLVVNLSSAAPAGGSKFTVTTSNGTATAGSDYTAISGTEYTIAQGQTSITINIPITNDTDVEGAENFNVTIAPTSQAVLSGGATSIAQTVTINDDDSPTISFTGATSVAENGTSISVGFQMDKTSPSNVTFNVSTVNGTATGGSDFTAISNQLVTITAGQTTGSISVLITDDDVYEGSENFSVSVTNVTNANGPSDRQITITDNETKPTLSISSGTGSIAEGSGPYNMTVNLSGKASTDVQFTVTTANGSATAGSDYTAISGTTYTITAGSTSVQVPITIASDSLYENDETFTATIAGLGGFSASGTTSQTITITDDDTAPAITISASAPSSVGEGAGNYSFDVTIPSAVGRDITFQVTTTDGTATGGADFTAQSGTSYTLTAGQTSKTVSIAITDDSTPEGNETFTVGIGNFSGATGGATVSKVVTINDNDLGITSATTMDVDGDGQIDHYKVVFNAAVTDSTFDSSKWSISGYSGIARNTTGTVGGETDTANDNTIYIQFTEKGTVDSGAKPDLTTSATGGINGVSGEVLVVYGTAGITEIDGAKPVIVSAVGTSGSTTLTVTFSEPVYGSVVATCSTTSNGNIQANNFAYTNTSSGGATAIASTTDNCTETDSVAVLTTTGTLAISDSGQDTIGGAATLIDAAGNQLSGPKTITVNSGTPPFAKVVEQYDTDYDGNIDKLTVTFKDTGNTISVDMNDSTLTTLSQFSVNGSAPTSVATGSTANDNIVDFTVSVTGTGPAVVSTFSFTRSDGGTSWLSTGSAQLANFTSGYTITDKAAPIIKSAVATDATNDKLTITFSEDIASAIRSAINSGNVGTYLDLKNGSGSTITMPSVSSLTWTNNYTLELTFSGDVSGTITDSSTITLNSTNQIKDVANNFYASSAVLTGSFTTDTTPPYLTLVTDITSATNYSGSTGVSTILVKFSEAVKSDGGTNAGNLAANYNLVKSDGTSAGVTISSITVVSGDTYQLVLSGRLTSGTEYKLTADNGTIDANPIKDLAGNNLTTPNILTFIANDVLRVLSADATSLTTVKVNFSRLLDTSTATCANSTACAAKYYFNPSLGTITSATASSNYVTITLDGSVTMKGMAYTLVAANGDSTDDPTNASTSFDTGSGDALKDSSGTVTLSGNPMDRITFLGLGVSVNTFTSGWYMDDPFADGSIFSFTFKNNGKVYVGPNKYNNSTLRFDPNGKNVVALNFRFKNGTNVALNCGYTTNNWGFGYESTYASNTDCTGTDLATGPNYVGPLKEIGLVGFNALSFTGGSGLFIGPIKNNATVGYYTQDTDNLLDMTSFDVRSFTGGGNTESIQTFFSNANNIYMGYSSTHGSQAPIMVRMPVTFSSGTISNINSANNSSNNMNVGSVPEIGRGGTPANPAGTSDAIGIDSVIVFNSKMYLANNGGVRFSSDLDGFAPSNGSGTTSATPSFTGTTLVLPGAKANSIVQGLFKVSPGQKGIPFMKTNLTGNRLYLVRNVAAGSTSTTLGSGTTSNIDDANKTQNYGELWVCDPTVAGTTTDCDNTSDWTLLLTTNSSVNDSTRLDSSKSNNKAISMLEITPEGVVYLGTDSPSGFRIYRNTLSGGLVPQSSWSQQGSDGMGTCATSYGCYTHIQSSAVAQDSGTTYYTYITVGKYDTTNSSLWVAPIKVYRQADVGTSVIVFDFERTSNMLLAYINKGNAKSKTLVASILILALIMLVFRRKLPFLSHH